MTLLKSGNRLVIKGAPIARSISNHLASIDHLTHELHLLQVEESLAQCSDLEQQVFNGKVALDKRLLDLTAMLDMKNHELLMLRVLEKDPFSFFKEVTLGALVVTDRRTFFVSGSLELITKDGIQYYCVPISNEIYKAMKGMHAGEKFDAHGIKYQIEMIY